MTLTLNQSTTPASAAWSTDPAMENASAATISGRAWACAIRFNAVASRTSQTASKFEDQLARFNIWAANLGVFAEAHASLDYRLRDSPKVKALMMQQLQALQRKLQSALDIVERGEEGYSDPNLPAAANTKSDDTDSESSQHGDSLSSTTSSNSSQRSASVSRSNPDPLIKTVKDIEAAINRLHRLAMSIRSSSRRNRNLTASKFAMLDENGDDTSTQFESFALRVVQARFPQANPVLHKRIANLILQRRKMFSYQQRHQQKLAQVVYPAPHHYTSQKASSSFPASQLVQPAQLPQRSVPSHPGERLQALVINKAFSATTASAFTSTSVLSRPAPSLVSSTAASSSPDTPVVSFPPAPKAVPNAKEFQCPYCGLLLGIKERSPRRWRKHVINDLEPYVCLFEHCNMGNQSFRSIEAWLKHMRWTHTLRWYCGVPNCQIQEFDEQTMFENHMELIHPGSYSSPQLAILSESMRRPATRVFQHCPLCNYVPEIQQNTAVNRKAQAQFAKADNLHKHVAAHLEALALLSLPWQNDLGEGSSSMDSPLEKRSTLKDGGVDGLDDVSLAFDDPPKLDSLGDEQNELNNLLQHEVPAVTAVTSREAEWGFVPSIPYDGHSQDRVLQNLLRKHLTNQVEKLGMERKIERGTGVSTEVELQTICDWISTMDFSAAHERISAARQEGTCNWFIQSPTVTDFIAHRGSAMGAVGIPGSGKTFLSSAIIDYLTRFTPSSPQRAAVAYAYCDYRMQESQTTLDLVACFLRQLLEFYWEVNVSVPDDVRDIYYLQKEAKAGPSMADCLKMLAAVIAGCEGVFVVIDGLDECVPATQRELVKTIRSVAPGIRLLITSRYLGDIKATLGDVAIVDISAPREDLKCCAQGFIQKYPELQAMLGTLPSETREAYLEQIAQSAAGMFPVVQFLIQAWADDRETPEAGPPTLSQVFRELDAFYSDIMMRIFSQPCPVATLARQILIWVAFSRRPVTVSEVADIIGAEVISRVIASSCGVLAGPELLTTVCAGILTIDSNAGTLRPAHVTLETYLQRNRESIFAQAQEYITTSCIRYLSFEEFKAGPCANDHDMLARLQKHPFFHYAANEWGHHALGGAESSCKEAIIAFLDNRQAVESAMQAKSITPDWQLYPQHVDSESYPHEVTGISLAAYFGLAKIVEALMDNSVNDTEGALFWAATGGSAEVIKLLLTRGVSPNVRGVMRAAADSGYEDVIRILVANGGDVNAGYDEDEGNALQAAAMKGNETLIRCLLELGADPNRVGGELGSVLHIAAVNGDESITGLLLKNGADPNTKGGMYGFALQAAVEEGHENIIQMLLDNGADVNLEGGPYGNAFQAAVENGDQDIVELLLAHGANINTMIGGEKYTALQEVARRGLEPMVEFLIDRGANMDSRQRNGQTALHQAAKEGQAGVVALLLRKGANPNIRDQRGFTALDWAKKKKFTEVVRVLEAARQF